MAPRRPFTDKLAEILTGLKQPNDQQNLFCWVGKWNITNSNSSSPCVGLTISIDSIGVHLFTLQWYTSSVFICWCAPNKNQNAKLKFDTLCWAFWLVLFFPPGKGQNMLNPSPVKHSWLRPARPLIVTRQCRRGPGPKETAGWKSRSWKGLTTRIWWVLFLGGKNKQENSTFGKWTCKERTIWNPLKRIVGLKNHYETR